MTSKGLKPFASSLRVQWIWGLILVIILVLIYAFYIADDRDSDPTFVHADNQGHFKNILTDKGTPLQEYFLSIQKTGADFNTNIVSDYRKFDLETVSQEKAAVNLGVYAADIGYFSAYGKSRQALNYFEACLELTKTVTGQGINDIGSIERFEKNSSNPDSLNQVLNQFNINVIRNLLEQERRDLGLLILYGAFIEALYISTQIINDYPQHVLPDPMLRQVLSPLVNMVLNQKGFLENLIVELDSLEEKGEWEVASLNSLKELYHTYTMPQSMFYPLPQEEIAYERISLLSEQLGKIRARLIS